MNIRIERKEYGISQMGLAKVAGVSRYRIQMHEMGYGTLRPFEQKRIRAALAEIRKRIESKHAVQLSLSIGGEQ